MKLDIEAEPKEIAALVVELQGQKDNPVSLAAIRAIVTHAVRAEASRIGTVSVALDGIKFASQSFGNEKSTVGGSHLKTVPTCKLVEELSTREGVERKEAEPYQDLHVEVNGPAIVLVVID